MTARTPSTLTALLIGAAALLAGCSTQAAPTTPGTLGTAPASGVPGAVKSSAVDVLVDSNATLTVKDQTSEGPTVNVDGAAITKGGFVVVSSDKGRNVLGTGMVPAGTAPQKVQVSLAEEITKKTPLIARLYADTNGDGLYGAGDKPVVRAKAGDDKNDPPFAGLQVAFSFTGKRVVNN